FVDPVVRQMDIQFKQRNVTLVKNIPEGLPSVHVDASKTEQVVMNFLSNALKFSKSGGSVTLSASIYEPEPGSVVAGSPRRFVRVSVTDNGVGIAKEELPLLFERYRQVSSAKVAKQKGTGLGLVICKLVVEAQKGTVSAESEPGKQTTFSFTLPVAEA
ncbi:MAG: ATP-binding protein, partial [Bacteroidota bacterium]